MDPLSDVLQVVRLSGAVFFTTDFSAPWAVASPPPDQLAALLIPGADCIALFHILAEGHCWVEMENSAPLAMSQGDVVVFPMGHPHVMASQPGCRPTAIGNMLPRPPYPEMPLAEVVHGGGGDKTRFVCGFLHCDQRFNPLFESLPRLLLVRCGEGAPALEAVRAGDREGVAMSSAAGTWLETTLRYTIAEAMDASPGRGGILPRLAELLFVDVIRHYMQQLPADETGWLAAIRDPQVSRALQLIHAEPTRSWTVDTLARRAAVSRSNLADRFARLVGETPIRYHARWRVQLAKQLLRQPHKTVAEVASEVGFESEAAFSRAFKRHTGEPPSAWRKR